MQSSSPPDPQATAAAQQAADIKTGIASAWMNNPNVSTPQGAWDNTVARTVNVDGQKVPQFQQTFKYSPGEQKLYDQNIAMGHRMNDIAGAQLGRLDTSLGQPIDFSGAPDLAGDFDTYRQSIEDGLFARLNPQLQRDEEATRTRLANMGLSQGSEAWREEMDRLGRSSNDARIQALLASGGEARAAGAFQNQNRQQYINELMSKRNQPLNEISALRAGGQVAQPNAPNWSSYALSSPDVAGMIYNSAGQAQAQQNAMYGGLFGLGGTLLSGGLF